MYVKSAKDLEVQHDALVVLNRQVGGMLGSMIKNPSPFLISDR